LSDNKRHIDDLFKDQFENFELPVTATDFQAIQDGLKKRKKRPFIWWFIFGALLIGAAYFMNQFGADDKSLSDNTRNTIVKTQNEKKPSASEGQTQNRANDKDPAIASTDIKYNEQGVSFPDNASTSSTPSQAPDPIVSTPEPENTDNDSEEEAEEWNGGDDIGQGPGDGVGSGSGYGRGSSKKSSGKDKWKDNDRWAAEKQRIAEQKRLEKEKEERKRADEAKRKELEQKLERERIAKKLERLAQEDKKIDTTNNKKSIEVPGPVRYRIGLVLNPAVSSQTLSQNSNADASFSEYKGSNEEQVLHLDYGLGFSAEYKTWTVHTGFNLTQYQFSQPRMRYQLRDSVGVYNPQGQLIGWIYKNYRDTTINLGTSLTYRTVGVPVSIGKEFEINTNWTIHAQVGAQLSFLFAAEGQTVNTQLGLSQSSRLPVKDMHIGLNGAVGATRRINSNWVVRLDLSTSQLSGNLYESTFDAGTALKNIGFKTSLMYELGKKK